jgi:two-component system nitrate/nitrite response regulator NarL
MTSENSRVRVLIAEDHPISLHGLADTIKRNPQLELVGRAATGAEALAEIRRLIPDVAVVDMKMPELDGVEVMRAVTRDAIATRVLFLSGYLDSATVYKAIEAGACGYISKDSDPATICDAITTVARGGTVFGPETHEAISLEIRGRTSEEPSPLSPREREILRLVAEGLAVSDVAARLFLSPATVKTHLQRSYQKLGVSERAAAVAVAMRKGLLD